jgi:hypothetical protein
MLDFVFGIFQAYNQVGLFLGALFCLGLGGLILGNALYWRVHALRATGTIIGVIDRNGTCASVYRYTLPDGQTHEAMSDTSSSAVRGKETGRIVPLMISAHDFTKARPANSYLFDAIGLVLIAPGAWMGYVALTAYPVTLATWIMAAIMLIYLAERGHRVFIPKGQRLSLAEWRKQHHLDGTSAINLADVKPIEKITTTTAAQQSMRGQLQGNRKMGVFVGAFAVLLLGVGMFQARDVARLESSGLRAQGTVVRMKGEWSSGSNSSYTYYAIVRFKTENNATVEFKDNVGGNPPTHRTGDKVTVLYLADNPRGNVMVDRGLFLNWAIPAIIFLFAGFLAWLCAFMLRPAAPAAPGAPGTPMSELVGTPRG